MPYVTLKFSLKIKHFVRQSLFFSLVLGGIGFPVSQALSEILPDIEAHQFKIMPLEKSRTGRVYRFKVDAEQLPKTGSILLIEENDKPTMAFRVLQTDFDHSEFVAKRVRRYDTSSELKINERYQAAEKIADLVAPPPPESSTYDPNAKPLLDPNPGKDLINPNATPGPAPLLDSGTPSTMTGETPAMPADPTTHPKPMDVEKYDDDLDSSTSPTNLKNEETTLDDSAKNSKKPQEDMEPADDGMETSDSGLDLEVKERTVLNPYRFAVGFYVGSIKNLSNFVFNGKSGGGFGGYFSHVIERNLFFRKKVPQDSLSMEYGFSYYNQNNYGEHNDDYTLVPVRAELRYDIHVSESFSPFLYFGFQYNWVAATENVNIATSKTDETNYNVLHGFQTNLGFGVFYNIGPQWYLRGELGLDRIAAGLSVKW